MKKDKPAMFIVYPNGYGTEQKKFVQSVSELNSMNTSSTAYIAATDVYEKVLRQRKETLEKRWEKFNKKMQMV